MPQQSYKVSLGQVGIIIVLAKSYRIEDFKMHARTSLFRKTKLGEALQKICRYFVHEERMKAVTSIQHCYFLSFQDNQSKFDAFRTIIQRCGAFRTIKQDTLLSEQPVKTLCF